METKNFAKIGDAVAVPDLVDLQRRSYEGFLQLGVEPKERADVGLEALFRETFPIENAQATVRLEYNSYELGKPRYTIEECRQLRLTYGRPLRVNVTLIVEGKQAIKEDVYLGEIPIMVGGGEFVVNGAERVIVAQLHRSPGVDFPEEVTGDRRMYSCRIIPERGSWIEMEINRRDVLTVRIDQSGKLPATLVLRALDEEQASNDAILRLFYETEAVKFSEGTAASKLRDQISADTVSIGDEEDRTIVEAGERITDELAHQLVTAGVRSIHVIKEIDDPLVLNTVAEDRTRNGAQALRELYARLRPGTPFSLEKARQVFHDKFFDPARYRLGLVGRFRINRKFDENVPESDQTLKAEDYINAMRYLIKLRAGTGQTDDIDHLGNRRVRTIGELATEEFRKGFLKMRRTVQDRMNLKDPDQLTPRTLINSKTVSSAIDYFFGRSELSQVVDQTNPLSQLVHERRLSALGPGGLNRKRAGFDVRDVHISHYGRICPIETPEGTNIGLITSLGLFSTVDHYGFLVTPYRVMKNGKVTKEIRYLRADEEADKVFAPADAVRDAESLDSPVIARYNGDYLTVPLSKVDFLDVSPKQIVGISAALIPFLEHSDANRALMGSNMQRQAVPLLRAEKALIATGLEPDVARNSGMVVTAEEEGSVEYVDAERVSIGGRDYEMRKFAGLNERTCLNQRPCVRAGDKVKPGQVIADGAATLEGELSLGRNVLVAFMPWDGYNFEDAILISERLVKEDRFTSVHIDAFEVEVRETKLGREEFTRDIPNVSERQLANLDETGIIRVGTYVRAGDILVGKVAPKSRSELTPEEKLLYAIFGKAGEDVRNDSLVVPSGVEGIVIRTEKFSSRSNLSEEKQREIKEELRALEKECDQALADHFRAFVGKLEEALGSPVSDSVTGQAFELTDEMSVKQVRELQEQFDFDAVEWGRRKSKAKEIYAAYASRVETIKDERERQVTRLRRGDELPSGVLEMVKVYVATKRKLSVGDKMAGRHGNKGVIARILPEEDMPFLPDGQPVEIVLNPLGVPSRMNVGQILETHLGWAARALGFRGVTPIFDGASEETIREALREAGLPEDGKARLYDGRTGEAFQQKVTVGFMYMLKLNHLVDDKVHARATGPYSLITQQPLGGKARSGGQRLGEMEVWALEAYGAAHILQELVTVKSDDVDGRTKIYESIVKGENVLEAGIPMAFEVLCNEVRGLCLNIRLEKKRF
jgi:DNA-directed RNA polymerase subunit beta